MRRSQEELASARLSTFVGSGQFSARFHRTHYADADDETQESATWRCGDDGCHQVVDDDEHKDGDEAIEADYYDDDYDSESQD